MLSRVENKSQERCTAIALTGSDQTSSSRNEAFVFIFGCKFRGWL